MAISLYMDHNVPRSITDGLRVRGINIITLMRMNNQLLDLAVNMTA